MSSAYIYACTYVCMFSMYMYKHAYVYIHIYINMSHWPTVAAAAAAASPGGLTRSTVAAAVRVRRIRLSCAVHLFLEHVVARLLVVVIVVLVIKTASICSSSESSSLSSRRHSIRSSTYTSSQSKVLTKPRTGKEKPHPSTSTGGSKPCVTK